MAILCNTKSGARVALQSRINFNRLPRNVDIGDNIIVKRYRNPIKAARRDTKWLSTVLGEYKVLKYRKSSDRYRTVKLIKKYLAWFVTPSEEDMYSFSEAEDARTFLRERREPLDRLVVVQDGTNMRNFEEESKERPIEELLEFLTDETEWFEHEDESGEAEEDEYNAPRWTMREIKKRMRQHNGFVEFPLNFPDIATPFLDKAVPEFLQTPQCTLLHDLMRGILNVDEKKLRNKPPEDPQRPYITKKEMRKLTQAWRLWQGTTMLSEAGTITRAHFDKYSMPTWISCVEGEIGFAWLVNPSRKLQTQWKVDPGAAPSGRWVFCVLRPGDTLYMPSGTVHLVFRRPRGKQTLGFAGHVLRKADLGRWLEVLIRELEAEGRIAREKGEEKAPYGWVLPPLMREVRGLVAAVEGTGRQESFGGQERLDEVVVLVERVMGLLEKLR